MQFFINFRYAMQIWGQFRANFAFLALSIQPIIRTKRVESAFLALFLIAHNIYCTKLDIISYSKQYGLRISDIALGCAVE